MRPQSVPAGWAATATGVVPLANTVDMGAVSPAATIAVHVGLQLRNARALEQIVVSNGTVTNAAFMSTYAPTATAANAVASYLTSQGFKSVTVAPAPL